jgi:hypothetical protein
MVESATIEYSFPSDMFGEQDEETSCPSVGNQRFMVRSDDGTSVTHPLLRVLLFAFMVTPIRIKQINATVFP